MLKPRYETKRVLIVVRTYPTPAKKGVEVSCTAAITPEGEWRRLFPVPYRFLTQDRRFRKYQWIDVAITKASDPRPESYKIQGESIKIVSDPLPTTKDWKARKEYVYPLRARSLCSLQNERDAKGHPTLGFFRPKEIRRLVFKPESPTWDPAQLAILRQGDLFEEGPQAELEKVPYSFKYEFSCDEPECTGHSLSCTDWEMGESWRKWKSDYGDEWESKFRQRYEIEMIEKNDTHFYVGTVHQHPGSWIIVGLFYPPRPKHPESGDLF
jgi:hypothetical protein